MKNITIVAILAFAVIAGTIACAEPCDPNRTDFKGMRACREQSERITKQAMAVAAENESKPFPTSVVVPSFEPLPTKPIVVPSFEKMALENKAQLVLAEQIKEMTRPLKAADLKDYWKRIPISSNIYRDRYKLGEVDDSRSPHVIYKTFDGPVWFVDFAPEYRDTPLNQRLVYLVLLSSDLAKGCGYAMEEFQPAPEQCFVEDKIMRWKDARDFLAPQVSSNAGWRDLEQYLRRWEQK
jgi:hypothetical protein